MIGDRNEPRGFLVVPRPVNWCAICRSILVVRWPAQISAIIWPLLAAVPNIRESNGMAAIGGGSTPLAESRASTLGWPCRPTLLRQYYGRRALGRAVLSTFYTMLV